jgi:hypothetical protein
MLENLTTGEKVIAGATAVGIAALIFHKPTRNAVGLADKRKTYAIEAYRYGKWDIETRAFSMAEAKQDLKDYRENMPKVKFRIRKES